MAKNPNNRSKSLRSSGGMTGSMKFFLAGCVAELYLLVLRRYYLNGTAVEQIAWYDSYLKLFIWGGVAVLALGLVLAYLWKGKKQKRVDGLCVACAGAFVTLASALVLWNMSILTLLYVAVPVVLLLLILWSLYDRECALGLTILGVALLLLWVCRRASASVYIGVYVKAAVVLWMLVAIVLAVLARGKKLKSLLPSNADPTPVYVSAVLSVLALAVSLVSTAAAYYAMWALAVVVFALAVYYTVKQL